MTCEETILHFKHPKLSGPRIHIWHLAPKLLCKLGFIAEPYSMYGEWGSNCSAKTHCTTRDCGVLAGGNVHTAIAPELSKSSFGNSTTELTATTLRHTETSIIELFTIAPSDPAKKFHPLHPLHLTNFTYMTGEPLRNGKET